MREVGRGVLEIYLQHAVAIGDLQIDPRLVDRPVEVAGARSLQRVFGIPGVDIVGPPQITVPVVLSGAVAQLGRLGKDQVGIAQRDAKATEHINVLGHWLDDFLWQFIGHELLALFAGGSLM